MTGCGMAGPDFLVIGAMKAGTTSLHHLLAGHPRIGMSRMKETDYFVAGRNLGLGPDWYRAQFPDAPCRGEVSPNYAKRDIFPGVPERVAGALPGVRLVFLARCPVARLASHYRHAWAMGAMRVPPERLLDSAEGRHMLETSRYAAQLDPWLARFGSERLLVLDFAALTADPQGVLDLVCGFLGLQPARAAPPVTRNEAASLARMPAGLQRVWRSRAMRRLDPLISRGMRDAGRRLVSLGPARPVPDLPGAVLDRAAGALAEDAARFRVLSGLGFPDWRV